MNQMYVGYTLYYMAIPYYPVTNYMYIDKCVITQYC